MSSGDQAIVICLMTMMGGGFLACAFLLTRTANRIMERTKCSRCGKVGKGSLGLLIREDGWSDVGPIDPFGYPVAVCPDHAIYNRSAEKRMGSFSSDYKVL